ncbi:hypothetical protein BDP27DRAFT_1491185 [Rhodocollybia butyracea]|uniref:Uncharacterized protein n=1 Tax=Rhodocollybia butyracea TaxID=206335 RepID=A0A9P5TZY7_9AGAR|nr:hypothetical protein BDP27DRAFT_1491185 [Rhodocollybia butyracea]
MQSNKADFEYRHVLGRTFLEILTDDSPDDMAVLQLDFAVDMDELAKQAINTCNTNKSNEPESTPPPSLHQHIGLKHIRDSEADSEADHAAEPPAKRPCTTAGTEAPKIQSAKNRHRRNRRAEKRNMDGHPRGSGCAFERYVLTTTPLQSELESKVLPIAEGAGLPPMPAIMGQKSNRTLRI